MYNMCIYVMVSRGFYSVWDMYRARAVLFHATVITMRQLTCTRIRLTARLASALECLYYSMYSVLAVRRKVPYTRRCSYSSIA